MNQNESKDNIYIYDKLEKANEKEVKEILKQLDILKLYDIWYKIEIEESLEINKKTFYQIFYIKRKDLLSI